MSDENAPRVIASRAVFRATKNAARRPCAEGPFACGGTLVHADQMDRAGSPVRGGPTAPSLHAGQQIAARFRATTMQRELRRRDRIHRREILARESRKKSAAPGARLE